MLQSILKSTGVFMLIVIGFILILFLPREKEVTFLSAFQIEADYPFSFELYLERIEDFTGHILTEKGLGEARTGRPVSEEAGIFVARSLKIVLPAFIVSMLLGTLMGAVQFYRRTKFTGKLQNFLSWMFSSIPDFFLFIAIQYLFILMMQHGLPHFKLYGHENWYSFLLPLISLSLFPFLHMSRFTSAALENEMGEEYVRTAYAKGLGDFKALLHMLWNCWSPIMNQAQMVMLYILSSLPIIEKLAGYNGAGKELLFSISSNDEIKALSLMLPFLFIMFLTIILSQTAKLWLVQKERV
ncbi:ABC transporter permease [Cytobacillus firmus]|uniref:ABC transporter permease subunit n=1 Tax=Cytobacillus firmus TaxID=1399 RepID=UPI001C98A467|nr:ABC transporter permease [Cytobacillus firmus]MBY6051464.1 ABC transporter permease [Cytobacillus firmus]